MPSGDDTLGGVPFGSGMMGGGMPMGPLIPPPPTAYPVDVNWRASSLPQFIQALGSPGTEFAPNYPIDVERRATSSPELVKATDQPE